MEVPTTERPLLSLVIAAAVAALLVQGCHVPFPLQPPPPAVPGENPVGAYMIETSRAGAAYEATTIGAHGEGCQVVRHDQDAYRTCLIATSLIPSLIGGEAYGELNERHTPAFDALVWRARADADPSVCARGGLEGAFLALCEEQASDAAYVYTAGDLRIRVPIGGAVPSPDQSP